MSEREAFWILNILRLLDSWPLGFAVSDNRILYQRKDHLAWVTINRPRSLNAIDPEMSRELRRVFEDFRDTDDAWVAVLTGVGRAFSTGADLKAADAAVADATPFGGITRDFHTWKPIIAAVNGYALGGGLELALCCDMRICSEGAQFALPEVRWGIMANAGGTTRLPRAVPPGIALKAILTGDYITAEEALRHGLVSDVVPEDELRPRAESIAERILANGPVAVRAAKQAALRGIDMGTNESLAFSYYLGRSLWNTKDAWEGIRAFEEKRPPRFEGQ